MDALIALMVSVAKWNYETMVPAASLADHVQCMVQAGWPTTHQTAQGRNPIHVLPFIGGWIGLGLGFHPFMRYPPLIAARSCPLGTKGRAAHQASGCPRKTGASVSRVILSIASLKAWSNDLSAR